MNSATDVKLFSPYTIKQVTLKNRIVMSPMCMYSCEAQDGKITDWHLLHYGSRSMGQVALIMVEATGVAPEGRISNSDVGIWSDEHVEGLKKLVQLVHDQGGKIGIQLAHAGRKSETDGVIVAPSAVPFREDGKVPAAMTDEQIKETVNAFKAAARRAKEAGFDVIEIHGAHGYLIHEFLSPIANQREDEYGGSLENRYRFLSEIITAVKTEWSGPLFVRISANDYDKAGNTLDTYVEIAKYMNAQEVDLIDCSSGGIVPVRPNSYPGYQVPFADRIRREARIPTGAVGLITTGSQAEEILQNERADLIFIGRELLYDPYWPLRAARELNCAIEAPRQYVRDVIGGRVKRF